jgi:hypothetical protein
VRRVRVESFSKAFFRVSALGSGLYAIGRRLSAPCLAGALLSDGERVAQPSGSGPERRQPEPEFELTRFIEPKRLGADFF